MKKKAVLICAALMLGVGTVCAQNVVEEAWDTLKLDELEGRRNVEQVPLSACQKVEACENTPFAVVTKDGKMGIYNLKKGRNVTPIAYESLKFFRSELDEWGVPITFFEAARGLEIGRISVQNERDDIVVGVWQDNSDLVGNLSLCTTVDGQITKMCERQLADGLRRLQGTGGQLAVVDAQSGLLKAWVALEMKDGKAVPGKLLKNACGTMAMLPVATLACVESAGLSLSDSIDVAGGIYHVNDTLTIRDHNWRSGGYGSMTILDALTKHSAVASYKLMKRVMGRKQALKTWQKMNCAEKASNAMELAAMFNSFCSLMPLRIPTLEGDSLNVTPLSETDRKSFEKCRDVLTKMNEEGAIQARYAPRGVKLAGYYSSAIQRTKGVRELSFVGAFPAEQPRYAVAVFVDCPVQDVVRRNADLAGAVVNPLIGWLMKR